MIAQTFRLEPHDSIRIAVLTELLLRLQIIVTIIVATARNRVVPPVAPGAVTLVLALLKGPDQTRLKIGIVADRAMMHLNLGREADRGALAEQEEKIVPPPLTMIVTVALVPRFATAQECLEEATAAEIMTDSPAQERFTAGHHAGS